MRSAGRSRDGRVPSAATAPGVRWSAEPPAGEQGSGERPWTRRRGAHRAAPARPLTAFLGQVLRGVIARRPGAAPHACPCPAPPGPCGGPGRKRRRETGLHWLRSGGAPLSEPPHLLACVGAAGTRPVAKLSPRWRSWACVSEQSVPGPGTRLAADFGPLGGIPRGETPRLPRPQPPSLCSFPECRAPRPRGPAKRGRVRE